MRRVSLPPLVPLHQKHGCKHAICTSFKIPFYLSTLYSRVTVTLSLSSRQRTGFFLCRVSVSAWLNLLLKFLLPPESVGSLFFTHPFVIDLLFFVVPL